MTKPVPLSAVPSVVVISDRIEGGPWPGPAPTPDEARAGWADAGPERRPWPAADMTAARAALEVAGGYLERLPLALVKAGIADQAEIWHHRQGDGPAPFDRAGPLLAYRALRPRDRAAPFASDDMLAFVAAFGAPHILVVLGLGVEAALLDACANSVRIYNSIDAPALRVPPDVSARIDIVLTGAQWQSDEVAARHPGMPTEILPIGPEFAAPEMFRPLGLAKDYDLIYVAAAQGYKRHDMLLDALERCPRDVRALCVFGYGELGDALRARAAERCLAIDFVGPPGVPHDEVNRLMNRARFGVVCGRDDGAPAILTDICSPACRCSPMPSSPAGCTISCPTPA